jgi:hypothetical protein
LQQLVVTGSAGLMEDYRRHSLVMGREVGVWEEARGGGLPLVPENPRFCGVVSEITDDLHLIVGGQKVTGGRISLARPGKLDDWSCRSR